VQELYEGKQKTTDTTNV